MKKGPDFELLCLPGMTEEFRLNLFIYIEKESEIKLVFVCEESNMLLRRELMNYSNKIF